MAKIPNKFVTKSEVKTPKVDAKTDPDARKKALAALTKGIMSSSKRIEAFLPVALGNALEAQVWSWPNVTLRQNGTTAGMTRDIVDTGRLKNSLQIKTKFLKTKTVFSIEYKAPYAKLVHDGGYIRPYGDMSRQMKYIPGRPWVQATLEGTTSGITGIDLQREFLVGITREW